MNIADAKQQIKDTVEAYLERDDAGMFIIPSAHQRPVFLLGAPGIGKTAIMEQVAEELGIGIVSYSMTHHTRQSALGLPRIEHKTFEGMSYDASEYTMSEIVSAIYDYMERTGLKQGILFLDEINCVSETLYPSMLQFLQFKTFGNFKVPDGWIVCCAGNPPEYNRSVHEFDIVTLDRLREISVEPDYAAWRAYALERGVHPSITTFLESKKDCFYLVESKPGGGKRFVTARGWDDLSNVISLYERLGKPVDRALIAQFIRDEDVADKFAIYYALFAKYRADYQVDSILAGAATDEVRARATAAEFDERVALMGIMLDALAQSCKQVLDICSRRGRGVYKISSMVGMQGRAIGVDWSPAFVQESIDGIERAWHDSGLPGNNMDFYVAYPEDLMTAGIGTSTMDVVYVNNVMTLFADQQQALNEFSRVLRPGGLLIMETVFADRERNEAIIQEAREIGNSIQAARTQDENFAWIKAAGFGKPAIEDEYDVRPDQGFKSDYDVPMVADDSGVQFKAVSMYIHKRP